MADVAAVDRHDAPPVSETLASPLTHRERSRKARASDVTLRGIMKVQVETVSSIEKRLSVEVESAVVEHELTQAYTALARR